MRIGLVCEDFRAHGYGGGISRYTELLGAALVRQGHEVHVFSAGDGAAPARRVTPDGLHLHLIPGYRPRAPGWRTVYWKGLFRALPGYCFGLCWAVPLGRYVLHLVRRGALDVLEVPETGARLVRHIGALQRELPVIVRFHAPSLVTASSARAGEPRHLRQLHALERRQVRAATRFSSPSRAAAELAREVFGLGRTPVHVLPNPAPPATYERVWSPERGSRPRVLFVGRLEPLKGIDLVVQAFAQLCARQPDLRLDLVGADPLGLLADGPRSLLARFAPQAGPRSAEAITWHGALPQDAADELRCRAACVVVPSRFETFSYTLVEAMRLGCPVVAARAGGMAEILEPDRTGRFFEPGDVAGLARQIADMIQDTAAAARLGAAARRAVAERYDADTIARRTAAWYGALRNAPGDVEAHAVVPTVSQS